MSAELIISIVSATISAISALTALLVFFKGIVQITQEISKRKFEYFMILKEKLKENESFQKICLLLETNDEGLKDFPIKDKRDFLLLFEDIALMMNSNLIREEVAHYMFSYEALKCWKSSNFWTSNDENFDINKNSPYWILFSEFVQKMLEVEKNLIKKIEKKDEKSLKNKISNIRLIRRFRL